MDDEDEDDEEARIELATGTALASLACGGSGVDEGGGEGVIVNGDRSRNRGVRTQYGDWVVSGIHHSNFIVS